MAIDVYRDQYGWLSNFSPHPVSVMIDGERWDFPNNECYFQAMKTLDKAVWRQFQLMTAKESKKAGNTIVCRPDWLAVRVEIMLAGLRSKFMNEDARRLLLNTGDEELIEGNFWGDIFWGRSKVTRWYKKHNREIQEGEGENWLGRLQMQVRDEIRLEEGP